MEGGNYNFDWLQHFNVVIIDGAKLGFVLQAMSYFYLLPATALELCGTISMSLIIALVHATCFVDVTSLSPATLVSGMSNVRVPCAAGGSNAHGLLFFSYQRILTFQTMGSGRCFIVH